MPLEVVPSFIFSDKSTNKWVKTHVDPFIGSL